MNLFSPQTGSEAEWNAAYYRLEDYLRAMHLTNKLHQNQVILRLLRAAAARHARNPEIPPTTLALDAAHEEMDGWFKLILADQDRSPISGRVDIHDVHATILHLFGLDHERLTFRSQGRDFRLTDVGGQVIRKLLA